MFLFCHYDKWCLPGMAKTVTWHNVLPALLQAQHKAPPQALPWATCSECRGCLRQLPAVTGDTSVFWNRSFSLPSLSCCSSDDAKQTSTMNFTFGATQNWVVRRVQVLLPLTPFFNSFSHLCLNDPLQHFPTKWTGKPNVQISLSASALGTQVNALVLFSAISN